MKLQIKIVFLTKSHFAECRVLFIMLNGVMMNIKGPIFPPRNVLNKKIIAASIVLIITKFKGVSHSHFKIYFIACNIKF